MDEFLQDFSQIALLRGDFTLRSGMKSDHYLDVKRACGNPYILGEISRRLWEKMNCDATCVVGYGVGGEMIAPVISVLYKVPLAILRDSPKDHGTGRIIEGHEINKEDRLAIPDDVFTKGTSMKDATELLRSTNARIIRYGAVVNREEGDPSSLEAPLSWVYTKKQILECMGFE